VFGGPGSGKTTFLELLVEANAGRMPVVVVDPKGSPALAETVRSHGGLVWTLDGRLPADLLDPRPWQVPDMLLEAEDYAAEARAYRDAAHQRALWAAWALALNSRPMDLAELRRLLDRQELMRALETRGLVLFSLDAADYPHATRKVAAWVLLAMSRLARQLADTHAASEPRALLLVDEVGALGSSARHLRGLVGRARESGLAVVLATNPESLSRDPELDEAAPEGS
jgi:nucleoside-triphosphatase THEP1